MTNDLYELFRVLVYPFGTAGLLYLSQLKARTPLSLRAGAVYFIMWAGLLVYLRIDPLGYRWISNLISTPVLFAVVAVIWLELWMLRRER